MWGFGVALQVRIPMHPARRQIGFGYVVWGCFQFSSMGVFEMRRAKKCGFSAWCSKGAPYLCTKYGSYFFGCLGWGCLKCTMPKKLGVCRGTLSEHTSNSAPHICQQKHFWMPRVRVFEMCNAKKVWGFGVALQVPLHQACEQNCS